MDSYIKSAKRRFFAAQPKIDKLEYFPINLRVAGRHIVVCGATQDNLAKVRLLLKTAAATPDSWRAIMAARDAWIIVTDTGFYPDSWRDHKFVTVESLPEIAKKQGLSHLVLRLENDQQLDRVLPYLSGLQNIAIAFPDSADGRGFSLASLLRLHGYSGRLRAEGSILADQYRHARQCGFDEVAISPALARRMPEKYWLEQIPRLATSYQEKIYARP